MSLSRTRGRTESYNTCTANNKTHDKSEEIRWNNEVTVRRSYR
jgi:hypothetical protein